MEGKRVPVGGQQAKRPPAVPVQAAPSPTGMTVAAFAQTDPKKKEREREKEKQRSIATAVIKSRSSAAFDVYEFPGSDTLQITPTLPLPT